MAYRALAVSVALLAIVVGCGDDPGATGGPFNGGGSSGSGGMAGSAGMSGSGGGGTAGTGATGSGGTGASGGGCFSATSGGSVGSNGSCVTSKLCRACPDEFLCSNDSNCIVGWVCIPSGCESAGGASIKQCQPSPGGSCNPDNDDADCPPEYECMNVPAQGDRCVKTTSGCNDSYDCVLGFSCEAGACVDRRMPCSLDADCPMNHSCESPTPSTRFCARIHRTCHQDDDCSILAPYCADIDGDGDTECAGADHPSNPACVNSGCTNSSAPVCEASSVGSITDCGQYGLCRNNSDCASGFQCVGLWPDGRKECVPSGGCCDQISDCPERQVCASPRSGGAPSCQAGAVL